MDKVRRSILAVLVIGTLLFGACAPSAPPPAVEKPSPTPTTPGTLPLTPPTVTGAGEQLQVHFINVGQGDAILIDYGTTEVLIDGGDRSPSVVPYLTVYVDGDLEAMVATHSHADHIGGLIDVLQAFQVDKIYWNGESADSNTYIEFMTSALAEPQSSLQQLKRGDYVNVGVLTFSVLNPPSTLFNDANNDSIVLKLNHGDIRFLFEGDAEHEAESNILAAGLDVDADILKVGHHASRSSSSMPFLEAVSPQLAIYMAGINNSYGHPHDETITALCQVGAQIYGTDIHGTIVVATDGQEITLTREIPAPPRAPPLCTPTSTQTPTPPTTTPPTTTPPTTTPPTTLELTLEIISVTSPVGPGYNATLVAKATPGAECNIDVYYKSGPSTAAGLYPKTADAEGNVSWTWKVGTRTTPGSWRIVVTASLAGKTVSQTTYFTVQ
jgi:competence protein ComEC